MYEPEEDYMDEGDETEEISNEIWQEVGASISIIIIG